MISLYLLLICYQYGSLGSISTEAREISATPKPSGGYWETQLAPKAVDVRFGNSHLAIWEHLTRPGLYYVSPLVLLLPETFKFERNILTGSSRITFEVQMWSDEARKVVYDKLTEEQEDVEISLLPMDKIRLVWKNSMALDNSILELPDTWMSNTHKQRIVTFKFVCHNSTICKDEILDTLKESPHLLDGLEMEYVISAKRTSSKTVSVSGTSFMSSSLIARMESMPGAIGSIRYLTANDVNQVANEVTSNVIATVVRDNDYEASIDSISVTEIIRDFLRQHQESTESFDAAMWNSVFWDPISTRPDKVTKQLNDLYTKSAVDLGQKNISEYPSDGSGEGSIVGLIDLGIDIKSSSKSEIQHKLSKMWDNKTKVKWTGEKFELQAMDLFRVNLAQFKTDTTVAFTDVKLYPHEKSSLVKVNVDSEVKERRRVTRVSAQLNEKLERTIGGVMEKVDEIVVKLEKVTERLDGLEEKLEKASERLDVNDGKILQCSKKIDQLTGRTEDKMKTKKFPSQNEKVATCQGTARDCTSIKTENPSATDGVYDLFLPKFGSVRAQCVMDSSGRGWTVLMARDEAKPHINFDRSYVEYASFFGDTCGEYWIGLEAMNSLTSLLGRQKLRIEFGLDGQRKFTHFIEYNKVTVAGKEDKFRINIGTKTNGTAEDRLSRSNDMIFSAHDLDQDKSSQNCAYLFRGGWWYYDCKWNVIRLTVPHPSDGLKRRHESGLSHLYWYPFYPTSVRVMVS